MKEFTIHSNEAGQRFDKYLKKLLLKAPGSFIYKMLRKKNITLNGKKADGTEKLANGDVVKLFFSDETFEKFSGAEEESPEYVMLKQLADTISLDETGYVMRLPAGENKDLRELKVVYEDVDVIIINKPSGMLSQKAKPEDISANEYILAYLIAKKELTESHMKTFKPSICNRLDRNTSGLLIAGKTLKGLQEMSKALKERSIQKYYRCIVKGEMRENTLLKGYLKKDERTNKVTISQREKEDYLPIETEYRPLKVLNGYTELEVHLITGRSHQIRAHLSSIGHPIIGDVKYGDKEMNERFRKKTGTRSQLLHACRIVFSDGREIVALPGTEYEKAWNYIRSLSET